MFRNLTLSGKALILLVGVPLACELSFFAATALLLERTEAARMREGHARDISAHANTLQELLLQTWTTSFVYHFSRSADFRPRYESLTARIDSANAALLDLVENDAQERSRCEGVRQIVGKCISTLQSAHNLLDAGDRAGARSTLYAMQQDMADLFRVTDGLVKQQAQIQETLAQDERFSRASVAVALIAGTIFNIALVCLLTGMFNRSLLSRLDVLLENTHRLAGGQPLLAAVSGTDEIGQLDQFFRKMASSLSDATRQERAVVDNAADVICSIDAEGKIASINPACLRVWGYSPDELRGSPLIRLVCPDAVGATLEAIHQTIGQKAVKSFESRIERKDGAFVDMLWSALWSPDDKTLFCVAYDITAGKQADQDRREFVTLVRNNLDIPLGSIYKSLSQVLAGGKLSGTGLKSGWMAQRNVTRLIALVDDLLHVESMESGKLELKLAPTDISEIVERGIQLVAGYAQQKGVRLESCVGKGISVLVDERRVVQVVVNLLSNAVKFSPKETVVSVNVEEDSDWVCITVADTGRGVPPELQESIFERFKQAEASDERLEGGSGLGLAICKAMVERHGGCIGVEPNWADGEIKGSIFWFRLPKQQTSIWT